MSCWADRARTCWRANWARTGSCSPRAAIRGSADKTRSPISRAFRGDRIDLDFDAVSFLSGDQSFVFIGSSAFFGAGQVRSQVTSLGTLVQADVNGDRVSDFSLWLDDRIALTADCFIL